MDCAICDVMCFLQDCIGVLALDGDVLVSGS
jgi:hypothetical protein